MQNGQAEVKFASVAESSLAAMKMLKSFHQRSYNVILTLNGHEEQADFFGLALDEAIRCIKIVNQIE